MRLRLEAWQAFEEINLVPKGGLEPPHPCEYMDLNHARLPIPPLRHGVLKRRPAKELKHLPRDSSFTNPAGDVNASPLRRLVGPAAEFPRSAQALSGRTNPRLRSQAQGKVEYRSDFSEIIL